MGKKNAEDIQFYRNEKMKKSKKGIYILANDVVYDQLIALLNSIEVNYSKVIPICIIPYDNNLEKTKSEIKKRKNAFIFDNKDIIKKWETFAKEIWKKYPSKERNIFGRHNLTIHRKFCVFDGPFKEYIFLDADTLIMNNLDFIFNKLKTNGFIVYDFQYKDVSHVYNIKSTKLSEIFSDKELKNIFCIGFFASKKNLFSKEEIKSILNNLKKEINVLYPKAPEQSLLNYMLMKTNKKLYNFALNLPKEKITGNCVVSKHFKEKSHILYDKGVRLTYLHYIGISSKLIADVCKGLFWKRFPYKKIFLYYRFFK